MSDHLFDGLVLCSTGLEPHVQEQVRKLVVACGGAFELDLVLDATTHLIAEAVGSQKHRVAIVHGLPVASPRWVFESFRARRLLEIDQFVPRALEGLVVCTTGLSDDSRGQVEQLTTLHGGVYDSNLEIGYTSVLIAQRPGGAKYEAAVQHGVPVVHISWLFACVERASLTPEEDYALEKVLQPSRVYRQLADEVDDAMLILPALVHECNLHQAASGKEEGTSHSPTDLTACFRSSDGDDNDGEWTDLFDNCVFHLVGFPPRLQEALQSIIRRGMGTIYYDLVLFQVTHIVVSPSLRDMAMLRSIEDRVATTNADATVFFISAKWIVDSLKCCRLEPEELYPVEIDNEHYHPDLLQAASKAAASTTPHSNSAVVNADTDMGIDGAANLAVDTIEQVEQLVNDPPAREEEPKPARTSSKFLRGYAFLVLCLNPDDGHLIKPMLEVIKKRGGAEAIALDYRDFGLLDPAQFSFLTHAVVCSGVTINEDEVVRVQHKFEEFHKHAETEHDEQNDAPPSKRPRHEDARTQHRPKRRRRRGALTFVSDLWLNCSLAKGEKLPYQSHELFAATLHQPRSLFPVELPLRCFRSVRASVSVYYDVDRLVVEELLRVAGARVTDNLKKDRNTHLICQKPIGRKFFMAEQWGLTIVTARWVVESMIQGKLQDASREEYQVRDEYDTNRAAGPDMSQETDASGPNTQ